jgi:hypothetical protein
MSAIPAYTPPRPRPATHLDRDADRAYAALADHGDVGTVLPALASDLRWTHSRTRQALTLLRAAGRAERTAAGTWLATEAA